MELIVEPQDRIYMISTRHIFIMNFAYVCSIVVNDVYNNSVNIGIINSVNDLDKVRQIVKDRYGIEFEEFASRFRDGWLKFSNITDNRDVALLVERVECL